MRRKEGIHTPRRCACFLRREERGATHRALSSTGWGKAETQPLTSSRPFNRHLCAEASHPSSGRLVLYRRPCPHRPACLLSHLHDVPWWCGTPCWCRPVLKYSLSLPQSSLLVVSPPLPPLPCLSARHDQRSGEKHRFSDRLCSPLMAMSTCRPDPDGRSGWAGLGRGDGGRQRRLTRRRLPASRGRPPP